MRRRISSESATRQPIDGHRGIAVTATAFACTKASDGRCYWVFVKGSAERKAVHQAYLRNPMSVVGWKGVKHARGKLGIAGRVGRRRGLAIWIAFARGSGTLVEGSDVNVGIKRDTVSLATFVGSKASAGWREIPLGALGVHLGLLRYACLRFGVTLDDCTGLRPHASHFKT